MHTGLFNYSDVSITRTDAQMVSVRVRAWVLVCEWYIGNGILFSKSITLGIVKAFEQNPIHRFLYLILILLNKFTHRFHTTSILQKYKNARERIKNDEINSKHMKDIPV